MAKLDKTKMISMVKIDNTAYSIGNFANIVSSYGEIDVGPCSHSNIAFGSNSMQGEVEKISGPKVKHNTNGIWAATALGIGTTATSSGTVAIGLSTTANGPYSLAAGEGTTTNAKHSAAFGYQTVTDGAYSAAFGKSTEADGAYSAAFGKSTIASGEGQVVVGKYNALNTTALFMIGNGADKDHRANILAAYPAYGGTLAEVNGEPYVAINGHLSITKDYKLIHPGYSKLGSVEIDSTQLTANQIVSNGPVTVKGKLTTTSNLVVDAPFQAMKTATFEQDVVFKGAITLQDGGVKIPKDKNIVIAEPTITDNTLTNSINIGSNTITSSDRSLIVGDGHKVKYANCMFIAGYQNRIDATDNRDLADQKTQKYLYHTVVLGSNNEVGDPNKSYSATSESGDTNNNLSTRQPFSNCQTIIGYHNISQPKAPFGAITLGKYNDPTSKGSYQFLLTVGKGYATELEGGGIKVSRSNAMAVDTNGQIHAQKSTISTGFDYAEMFEWQDTNPNQEDRIGYLVSLQNNKIILCQSNTQPLGIVSGTSSVIGDGASLDWKHRFLTDKFGRVIYQNQEIYIEVEDPITGEVKKELNGIEKVPVLNPEYDPTKVYVPRQDRPEWATVGLLGKIYTRDDGTCIPGGYGKPADGGILTHSDEPTQFYIMERTAADVVLVFLK